MKAKNNTFNMGLPTCKFLFYYISMVLQRSAQSIDFRVDDFDIHRVVFPLETDVRMTCVAPVEAVNPQIQITYQGLDVSGQQGKYVINRSEYRLQVSIPRVNETYGGTYDCLVAGQEGLTENASLYLNVQDDGGAFCFHDTESLNFTEGDYFRVFCFFPWFAPTNEVSPYDFKWKETIGAVTSSITDSSDVAIEDGVKGIVVGDVGPLQLSDQGHIYICVHPMQARSGSKECAIGPINVTPRPTALSPTVRRQTTVAPMMPTSEKEITASSKNGTRGPPGVITMPMSTMFNGVMITSNAAAEVTPTNRSIGPEGISATVILLTSAAALSAVVFILIVTCLYCLRERNEGENVEKTAQVLEEGIDHEMTENPVYDGSEYDSHPEPKFIRASGIKSNEDTSFEHLQDLDPYDGSYLKPKSAWVAGGDGNDEDDSRRDPNDLKPSEPPRTYDNFRRIIGDVEESYNRVNNNRELSNVPDKLGNGGEGHVYDVPPIAVRTSVDKEDSSGGLTLANIWDKYGNLRRSMMVNEENEESVLY